MFQGAGKEGKTKRFHNEKFKYLFFAALRLCESNYLIFITYVKRKT